MPSSIQSGGSGGTNVGQLPPSQAVVAPFGVSTGCSDAIVGADEECDDGNEGSDACTAHCQTRDQPAAAMAPAADRYLGAGRHPIAGLASGFINTYVEFPDGDVAIGATLFNIWGQPAHHVNVGVGASPIEESNPVAAALPNGAYAVAWGDFDGDGSDLGVALRKVNADGSLGTLGAANASPEFSQLNPDMVWTGSQLVVAWEDYSDAFNGPDLRYRFFDGELNPTSADLTLASSALPEAAVSLAAFNGSWAAAYREGTLDGRENIVVKVGDAAFRIGPVLGGPADERPALVALDGTHLLVVFSAGTDPGATGVFNIPRLRYSVIDTTSAAALTFQSLDPLDDVFSSNLQTSQLSPSLARGASPGPDSVYLAWRSEARPGDAGGDQVWLKYLSWTPTLEAKLGTAEPEKLIPRLCEGSIGDQRRPAIASVQLPPNNALAMAWDDYSHSQGVDSGDPDVVVHYAPLRPRPEGPKLVTENWNAAAVASWPAQWNHIISAGPPNPMSIVANQGQVNIAGAGQVVSYVNNHTALDVEMLTKVRPNLNSIRFGFVARLVDGPQPSYLEARVGTLINDTWKIVWVANGAETTIANGPNTNTNGPLAALTNWGQAVDFFMRFQLTSTGTQSITISIKFWVADIQEPDAWTISATTSDSAIMTRFGNTPGRFGLYTYHNQASRITTYDDFRATFYEGAVHGALTAPVIFEPLDRGKAFYRTCTEDHRCVVAEGCCFDDLECASGTTCQSAQNEIFGLGSQAKTCSVAHCADKKRDGGEPRVDCGGSDCAACQCPSTIALGATGYCSVTNGCFCGIGEGPCTASNQCLPGLICKPSGAKYGLPAFNVCQPFHCVNLAKDGDAGETGVDCGGDCGACP